MVVGSSIPPNDGCRKGGVWLFVGAGLVRPTCKGAIMADNEVYDQMVILDELESLREQMEEVRVSSRTEAEARMAAYPDDTATQDVLDLLDELAVENLTDLNDRLNQMHVEMDQDEDVEEV